MAGVHDVNMTSESESDGDASKKRISMETSFLDDTSPKSPKIDTEHFQVSLKFSCGKIRANGMQIEVSTGDLSKC